MAGWFADCDALNLSQRMFSQATPLVDCP